MVKPSPMRIEARCKHFGVCGGCQFQHLKYSDQLIVKQEFSKDVLSRVGGLSDISVNPIVPSASEWDYRNHVQYHLDANGFLGYQRHSSHEVVKIEECFLPVPGLKRSGHRYPRTRFRSRRCSARQAPGRGSALRPAPSASRPAAWIHGRTRRY